MVVGNTKIRKNEIERRSFFSLLLSKTRIEFPLVVTPTMLPMIVTPNNYDSNQLGGYLLNDVDYSEDLFIEKKRLRNEK